MPAYPLYFRDPAAGYAYKPFVDTTTGKALVAADLCPALLTVIWTGGVKPAQETNPYAYQFSITPSASSVATYYYSWGGSTSGASLGLSFNLATLKWSGFLFWKHSNGYDIRFERQCTLPSLCPAGEYVITEIDELSADQLLYHYDVCDSIEVTLP